MLSTGQIRAARALLRWSAEDLSINAGVGVATVRRLELQEGVPSSNVKTLESIQKTFEQAGVEFIGTPDDRPGVRLNLDKLKG